MLQFDPEQRASTVELLQSPIFDKVRNAAQEEKAPFTLNLNESKNMDFRKMVVKNLKKIKK